MKCEPNARKDVIDIMYGLAQYLRFDSTAFLKDKVLSATSCGPLKDFETKRVTGSKVVVVITKDETHYKPKADGTAITNLFEKITVKLPGKMGLNIPVGSVVELINPTGTVYGEYRNQLSITADDIKVIGAAKG